MIFDAPAKSRRRVVGRIIWPVLIAIALILAVVVTAAGDETRAELEYLDEIKTQAQALSRSGASIREMMPRVRELSRDEFTTVFDGVTSDVVVAESFVAEAPPADTLIPVWSLYRQAIGAWSAGIDGLSTGILLAADQPDDDSVTDAVADALAELRVGDSIYQDLMREFEREEVPDPLTPLVEVALSPAPEGGLTSLSSTYVAAARSSTNNLGLRPGLKVSQVRVDPEWQLNVDSQLVVPATEEVTFSVVVTNVGNVGSSPETLTIEVLGGPEPVLATAEVPALGPSNQVTIPFDPIGVDPETLYEIRAEIIAGGADTDLTDNIHRTQFIVNAP